MADPSPLNLHLHTRVVEAVEVDSEVALTVVVVADSVEVVAGSVEDVEEDTETEGALVTGVVAVFVAVAVASEATGMTLDRREVEGATGQYLVIELVFA